MTNLPVTRRGFVKAASALMAGALAPSLTWATCKNSAPLRCGVQLFMFREALATRPMETLQTIAESGFAEVELFGVGGFHGMPQAPLFGQSLARWKTSLSNLNLKVPSAHMNGPIDAVSDVLPMVEQLGINYLVEPMAEEILSFDGGKPTLTIPSTQEDIKRMAERLNRRGKAFQEAGVGFAYHNHHFEFSDVEGTPLFDTLLTYTDPELVLIELDLGWAAIAGKDPVTLLKQLGRRVVACHMKDVKYDAPLQLSNPAMIIPEMAKIRTPGKGDLDFNSIAKQLDEMGVENRFVEVDVTDAPLQDAIDGLNHLRERCAK